MPIDRVWAGDTAAGGVLSFRRLGGIRRCAMSDKERDPDEGFEIVDRRTRGSEETESEAPAEEPSDEASGEADEPDDLETALPPEVLEVLVPSSVESVLHGAFTHLARLAWEHIGLVPSARTGKIHADFAVARRAIDAAQVIADQLRSTAPAEVSRDMESTLTDLKVNLVKQEWRQTTDS